MGKVPDSSGTSPVSPRRMWTLSLHLLSPTLSQAYMRAKTIFCAGRWLARFICHLRCTQQFRYPTTPFPCSFPSIATVEKLDQRYLLIPANVRDCYLVHILREDCLEKTVIVFTHTCRNCQVLANMLRNSELPCVALHSLMSQGERLSSLAKFKSGVVKILVATDVASRGLDIPQVEFVINSNVPASPKDYVHRVGRTARAGRGGVAITLVTQYDIERVKKIEAHINTKMTEFEVDENDVLKLLKAVLVARREAELRVRDSAVVEKRQRNHRKKLILEGKNPDAPEKKKWKRSLNKTQAWEAHWCGINVHTNVCGGWLNIRSSI